MLGDRQAESVSVGFGGEVRPEYPRLDILGDTGTVVGHGYLHLALGVIGIEHDDDIGRRSLEGITKYVNKDLRYLLFVSQDHDSGVRSDIADGYLLVVLALKGNDVRQFLGYIQAYSGRLRRPYRV